MAGDDPGLPNSGFRERLRADRTALLIVDVQNDFCHPDGKLSKKLGDRFATLPPVIDTIARLAKAARAAAIPVIHAQAIYDRRYLAGPALLRRVGHPVEEDLCLEGTWGADLCLAPEKDDIVLVKHRYSAFFDTPLADILAQQRRTSLAIGGVTTNTCVMASALDASFRGLYPALVADGAWSPAQALHETTLSEAARLYADVCPADALIRLWT